MRQNNDSSIQLKAFATQTTRKRFQAKKNGFNQIVYFGCTVGKVFLPPGTGFLRRNFPNMKEDFSNIEEKFS